MKSSFVLYFLFAVSAVSAQKQTRISNIYLLDSLRDECFYKIEVISETLCSKENYHFMIGRAQIGFMVSGLAKKIDNDYSDTTRKVYKRKKLEKSQLDSLNQFELKLSSLSNQLDEFPRQIFIISNQAGSSKYTTKIETGYNPLKDLLLILFRVKD